jgi:hypothetical protein
MTSTLTWVWCPSLVGCFSSVEERRVADNSLTDLALAKLVLQIDWGLGVGFVKCQHDETTVTEVINYAGG